MNNYISIRVLQHDTCDQIRIGVATCLFEDQLDKAVQDIVAQYEKETAWCGGLKAAFNKYYKRIAIVDAHTLEVLRDINPTRKEV